MTLPRVLLVEDDPSIARFVELAIEDLPIQLVIHPTVASALPALALAPFALIITDLMLPGESGLSLLRRLHENPSLRQDALLAVFSAGLDIDTRSELSAYPIWRLLSKPASVTTLIACVNDALQEQSSAEKVSPEHPLPAPTPHPVSSAQEVTIRLHFAGDADLFRDYRQTCLEQFARDLDAGDAAVAAMDLPSLRRLAHSLKTVLLTLGEPMGGQVAAETERAVAAGDTERALAGWRQLRNYLF